MSQPPPQAEIPIHVSQEMLLESKPTHESLKNVEEDSRRVHLQWRNDKDESPLQVCVGQAAAADVCRKMRRAESVRILMQLSPNLERRRPFMKDRGEPLVVLEKTSLSRYSLYVAS